MIGAGSPTTETLNAIADRSLMIKAWLELKFAGVPISFSEVLGMAIRRSLKRELITALVVTQKADLKIPVVALEAHALANGRPDEVVKAAVLLQRMGEPFDYRVLSALDLGPENLPRLVKAYSRVKEAYPDFTFKEFTERLLSGEEVISAAEEGSLVPLSKTSGWQVRVEYGPLSPEALKELLERVKTDASVSVRRPDSDRWEPASRVCHAL